MAIALTYTEDHRKATTIDATRDVPHTTISTDFNLRTQWAQNAPTGRMAHTFIPCRPLATPTLYHPPPTTLPPCIDANSETDLAPHNITNPAIHTQLRLVTMDEHELQIISAIVVVGVFPRWLAPTSEFVCVLPLPDGDARRTQVIYPSLGKEGPTSSGGGGGGGGVFLPPGRR